MSFVTVTTPPVFAPIADNTVPAIEVSAASDMVTFAVAATTNDAVVTNAAVTSVFEPVIMIAFDTVTTPLVIAPIVDKTVPAIEVSAVSDIVTFAVAATTNDPVVINAAVNSVFVPVIIIAFVTVTTPDVFAPIADNTVPAIEVSAASDTVTNAVAATTNDPVVTNAAVNSDAAPVIFTAFDTVTVPVVLPPIVDKSVPAIVAAEDAKASSDIVMVTSGSFNTILSNLSKSEAIADFKFATVSETPPWNIIADVDDTAAIIVIDWLTLAASVTIKPNLSFPALNPAKTAAVLVNSAHVIWPFDADLINSKLVELVIVVFVNVISKLGFDEIIVCTAPSTIKLAIVSEILDPTANVIVPPVFASNAETSVTPAASDTVMLIKSVDADVKPVKLL